MKEKMNDSWLTLSLFTHATEGIILANREGQILLINPAGEKMFGYLHDELNGKSIELLIPATLRQKHIQHREGFHHNPVNRSMGAGRDLYAEKKDGSTFPVEISLSHYRSESEDYVIAFIIDITTRKRNEKIQQEQQAQLEKVSIEVRLLNSELEQKVHDRTTMLRETLAQLEKSKHELELSLEKEKELGDLKSRFVSTVSHEFRTPLSTILSSAALLSKYTKSEQQDKRDRHINRITDSVRHLNSLLEDLLSLGKLDEGLVETKQETVSIPEFVADFIQEMQVLTKSGQSISYNHEGAREVVTDKRLLRNILINLVSNAIKFSPENDVVELTSSVGKDRLHFMVTDHGIGISDEDKTHLFERFFRARNALNIEGTGLGLHIVSKYIELLKGHISLHSEIGQGSTFSFDIPLNKPAE